MGLGRFNRFEPPSNFILFTVSRRVYLTWFSLLLAFGVSFRTVFTLYVSR